MEEDVIVLMVIIELMDSVLNAGLINNIMVTDVIVSMDFIVSMGNV